MHLVTTQWQIPIKRFTVLTNDKSWGQLNRQGSCFARKRLFSQETLIIQTI